MRTFSRLIIILISLFVCSCNDYHIEKDYYGDGSLKCISKYKRGLLEGKQILYHSNGNIKEIKNWISGNPVDSVFIYDKSGSLIKKGFFVGNKLKLYDLEENLILESSYKGSVLDGQTYTYNNDGSIRSYFEYLDGKKSNIQLVFFPDSILESYSFWSDGVLSGRSIRYYQNGIPKQILNFRNGKIYGILIEYYESGILKSKGEYLASSPVGLHYFYNGDGSLKETKSYFVHGKE